MMNDKIPPFGDTHLDDDEDKYFKRSCMTKLEYWHIYRALKNYGWHTRECFGELTIKLIQQICAANNIQYKQEFIYNFVYQQAIFATKSNFFLIFY